MSNSAILTMVICLLAIMAIEVYPHLEGVATTAGSKLQNAVGYTPDTSQLGDTKQFLWGVIAVVFLIALVVEVSSLTPVQHSAAGASFRPVRPIR